MAFYLHELLKYGWSGFFYFYKSNQRMSKKWPHEHEHGYSNVLFSQRGHLWCLFPSCTSLKCFLISSALLYEYFKFAALEEFFPL